ncbi:putative transposase [Yersinia pestis Pestoides A]|nr:putative transposase [Yersinia pestis Pestoides A]
MNSVIRAAIKKRKVFPTDDSVRKVVYLAIKDASKKWSMPIQNWRLAMSRFIIEFGDPPERSPLIRWQLHRIMDRLILYDYPRITLLQN